MQIIEPIISLMLDSVVLWVGSHLAVTSYENVGRDFKLSHMLVGLTVVAVGTLGVAFVGVVLVGL